MFNNTIRIKNERRIRRLTFLLDELSIVIAFFVAIALRFKAIVRWADLNYGIYVTMLITTVIFEVLTYYIYDYRVNTVLLMDPFDNFTKVIKSRIFLGVCALSYLFVTQRSVLASRAVIALFLIFSAGIGFVFRMILRYKYLKKYGNPADTKIYEIRTDSPDIEAIKEEIDAGEYECVLLFSGIMNKEKEDELLKKLRKAGIRTFIALESRDYKVRNGITTSIGSYEAIPAYVRNEKCRIFGIDYAVAKTEEAVHHVLNNLEELKGQYICFSNVHTSVMARENHDYLATLNGAAYVFSDGAPIHRIEKLRGFSDAERVAGPDFMENMFRDTMDGRISHYFYGSTEETLSKLKENLLADYPGINIKGMYSPPFRKLTDEEDAEDIKRINESGADIVWIGLGAPKQENWMRQHKGKINAVMMGVGAGFDFHAGTIKRAPLWIRKIGLEWLYRLFMDPIRLFKRYFISNIKFVFYFLADKTRTTCDYHTIKRQVFCIGCKGIPAEYGGFETFMDNLTKYRHTDSIRYHVARIAEKNDRYFYNDAKCFNVKTPQIGAGRAVIYDLRAIRRCITYCKERPDITDPVFFIMACRIGPFMGFYKRKIRKLGGTVVLNPDGHDWARRKWAKPVRAYWKISEKLMVKHADRIVCDSREIEKYINREYAAYNPNTTFIAYGADVKCSSYKDDDQRFTSWLEKYQTKAGKYYIVIGRFVEENNFDIIIREFMKTSTDNKLIILTTPNDKLANAINKENKYSSDSRIVIADPVYDKELVKKIRENAFAYIHGHEVGGTNPSLLEALASTSVNLVLDVKYNKEVVENAGIYWTKDEGSLAKVIVMAEKMSQNERNTLGSKAKDRIKTAYTWDEIARGYENEFVRKEEKI